MPDTYADKRAELEAVATGGSAGRDAYREGRQRVVSDQRAALDRALGAVPTMNREAGTNDYLESIIRPAGDNATARLGFAGDRFGSSMGALDSALAAALAQQGGARDLNYSTRLADGRQSTDRSMNLAREQDAAAERRRRAAEEEAGIAARSKWEQEALAEGLGETLQSEQARRYEANDFLTRLLNLGGNLVGVGQEADNRRQGATPEELLAPLLNPANGTSQPPGLPDDGQRTTAEGLLEALGLPSPTAAPDRPGIDNRQDIDTYLDFLAEVEANNTLGRRRTEADRYLFNRDAYSLLGGDPLLGAGLFPEDYDAVGDVLDERSMIGRYLETGLPPSQYKEYEKEQERREEMANESLLADIAADAGASASVVSKVIKAFSADPNEIWNNLLNTEDGAAVIRGGVAKAAEAYDGGMSHADVKRNTTAAVKDAAEEAGLGDYGDVLAAIVREQYDALYG